MPYTGRRVLREVLGLEGPQRRARHRLAVDRVE